MKKEMKMKRVYHHARMEPVLLSSRASLLAESGDPGNNVTNPSSGSGALGRVNYVSGVNPFQD